MAELLRTAELLAAVSAATDFARGLPEEQALRTCRVAMAIAERAGLGTAERQAVFHLSLLRFVGCTATAPEMAAALGDELAVSSLFAAVDPRDLRAVVGAAAALLRTDQEGAQRSAPARAAAVVRFLGAAPAVIREHEVASCEVARMFAARVGLPAPVGEGLSQVFERWDGRGNPGVARGAAISLAVRVEQVAHATELLVRTVGPAAAVVALRRRAGSSFDPDLVDLVCSAMNDLRADLDDDLDQAGVLAAEPRPWLDLEPAALDTALAAIGAVADLKSTYTRGHAAGVADRAAAAAGHLGLPAEDVVLARRAGWLHDIGRVAVSARVWDKAGPLTAAQWEQVRLHPYVGERVLARCAGLADVAALVGAHHERVDGSGYHRGARDPGRLAVLLATADAYQAMGEDRAHRRALVAAQRRAALRAEAEQGRLPQWAVDAVLAGPGEPVPRPAAGSPVALTSREREVLALVARGQTNRAIAANLGIAAKTVNAHLEHIFTKLGVTTRGAAAFYAVDRGLLDR